MAPSTITNKRSNHKNILKLTRNFLMNLLFDVNYLKYTSVLILIAELFLSIFIIQRVSYTEIDWTAYMQECEGFLNGTTNYAELKGDTGPLVYPAGFVYIYSILYYVTAYGKNIRLAQYIFMGIYLLQMYLVLRLYKMSRKVPPIVLILSAFTSYRIHSIYLLRLFNDPIGMIFLYAALNLFMDRKWTLGSICFSLGVSVKMNILLFSPAVLLLYLTNLEYSQTIKQLMICALVQLSLGSPFLLTYPIAYINGSFDLARIFEHKWTVNYRFLDRDIFESEIFHVGLLIVHLILLGVFIQPCVMFFQNYNRMRLIQDLFQPQIDRENTRRKFLESTSKFKDEPVDAEPLTEDQEKFIKEVEKSYKSLKALDDKKLNKQSESKVKPAPENEFLLIEFEKCIQLALLPIFLCNFIGVICARSLHYQFYVWYFHSLPYLTWFTDIRTPYRYLLLGLIEYCWNTYPSTNVSSILLNFCHLILLYGISRKLFKTKSDSKSLVEKVK